MDESVMRRSVLRALKPLDGVFIENVVGSGTADINYVEGWLELKYLANWPVRPTTPVALPKFTPQQRVFLTNRCLAGGQARFLLRVGREWLLLPGLWSALHLGKGALRTEIEAAAELHWSNRLLSAELVAHLRNPPPPPPVPSSLPSENVAILSVYAMAGTSTKPPARSALRAGNIKGAPNVTPATFKR